MDIAVKSDSEIIETVLSGDTDAFAFIIEKYKGRIFKIVSSHIPPDHIEEVANDVFFKAFKSLKTFKNDAPLLNWMSVIAVRACKDHWRISYARKDISLSSFDEETEEAISNSPVDCETPEEQLLNAETKTMLNKAIEKLKPNESMIINMIYAEERSVAETAELMEMTESNVKIIAFRARKKLAELMNGFSGGANE